MTLASQPGSAHLRVVAPSGDTAAMPPRRAAAGPEFEAIIRFVRDFCGVSEAAVVLTDAPAPVIGGPGDAALFGALIAIPGLLTAPMVEIEDTLDERRFDPDIAAGMRFFAAVPLFSGTDGLIGALCIADSVPRVLTELQRDALSVLAGQVVARLDLRRALEAQAVLASEADHRIKNSLQTLAAMVRFQARGARTEETRDAMGAMQARIEAMSLLHEMLQPQSASPVIDLQDYLLRVVDFLSEQAPPGVGLEARLVAMQIAPSKAASIGVIVSEWVANAFKHAFPDGLPGHVEVSLIDTGSGTAQLQVADDGIGVATPEMTPGLGSQITAAALRNLDATSTADADQSGLRQRLIFAP